MQLAVREHPERIHIAELFAQRLAVGKGHAEKRGGERIGKTAVFRQQKLNERILRMVKYMSEESGILLTTSRKRQRNTHKIKIVEEYDYEVA